MLYPKLIRPAVFRLTRDDPELAHHLTVRLLRRVGASRAGCAALRAVYAVQDPRLEREVFGIRFPNPVGLAGGFDKDGEAIPGLAALGFGFIEVGTVTWQPQPGNPRPRLFRLPASGAVINRMGFNNAGARALAARLRALGPRPVPIGASIGKSKVTPLEEAVEDYRRALEVLYPHADYFAVNVSSPNTPGLRSLQDRDYLEALLGTLADTARGLAGEAPVKPILVKIAPDLTHDAVLELLEVAADNGVAGIIATNTTLAREGLDPREAGRAGEAGGLSGAPLTLRARELVAFIHQTAGAALPVIGVGGVMSADDALRLFDAGASLVQVYTGMIYAGPAFAGQINRAILERIE